MISYVKIVMVHMICSVGLKDTYDKKIKKKMGFEHSHFSVKRLCFIIKH